MAKQGPPLWYWRAWAPRHVPRPLEDLRQVVTQTVEDYWRGLGSPTARPLSGIGLSPQIDVTEDDDAVTVFVELPGVAEEEIDVSFSGGILRVRGEKEIPPEARDQHHALREREFGQFERAIAIGPAIAHDRIKATCSHGTLAVVLPKATPGEPRVRRIPVK